MTTEPCKPWGSTLPSRGRQIALMLCDISNVTLPLVQRMNDAEVLARMMNITPHAAWMLAMSARFALGYGPSLSSTYRQILNHEYPTEIPRTAAEWLKAASLDDNGCSFAMPGDETWVDPTEPPPTPEEEDAQRSADEVARVKAITDSLFASWGIAR